MPAQDHVHRCGNADPIGIVGQLDVQGRDLAAGDVDGRRPNAFDLDEFLFEGHHDVRRIRRRHRRKGTMSAGSIGPSPYAVCMRHARYALSGTGTSGARSDRMDAMALKASAQIAGTLSTASAIRRNGIGLGDIDAVYG